MVTTVFGRRGSGKTTFIKKRCLENNRVVILDFLGEYQDVGVPVFRMEDLIDFLEERPTGYFRVVYQPHDLNQESAFDYFCRACWVSQDVLCVVDEIDMVSSPSNVPDQLHRSLNLGRHRGISFIAASRRPAATPRLLTSVSDSIVFFNTSEPRDVKYAAEVTGSKVFAEKLRTIPQYCYLVFDAYSGVPNMEPRKEAL